MSAFDRVRQTVRALDLRQLRPTDLLESHSTEVVHLEITSKCNLRCTFCAVSQPTYRGRHLDGDCLENVITGLIERRPGVVTVNGHGETTIFRDWYRQCDRLLDAGIELHIISNFARPLAERELETLCRFRDIEISCDSHDPKVFAQLRRGAELPTLLANIEALRATAQRLGREPPPLSLSCVVSDLNVLELPAYAAFVEQLGVAHVNFCNLTKYPDLPGVVNPRHVTEMAAARLPAALAALEETFRRLEAAGIAYHCQSGLLDSLRARMRALAAAPGDGSSAGTARTAPPASDPETAPGSRQAPPVRYSTPGGRGMTRDCLDPWKFLFIQANREVAPCCWHRPVHSLGTNQPLSEVLNGRRMRELRRSLLTGELTDDCRSCPSRGWVPTGELRRKVWRHLNGGLPFLGAPWAMRLAPPPRSRPLTFDYLDGWYDLEQDPRIASPDRRSWRWTGPRASCRLSGCRPGGTLTLRLGVNRARCPGQEVSLTINGRELDRFVPVAALSTREYGIGEEQLAGGDGLELSLAVDKTFVPAEAGDTRGDHRELGVQVFEVVYGERA